MRQPRVPFCVPASPSPDTSMAPLRLPATTCRLRQDSATLRLSVEVMTPSASPTSPATLAVHALPVATRLRCATFCLCIDITLSPPNS
jgi:hypothetical protein